jgi:hypothetical protein
VLFQPRDQNIAVGFVVVDDQDTGGIVHGVTLELVRAGIP